MTALLDRLVPGRAAKLNLLLDLLLLCAVLRGTSAWFGPASSTLELVLAGGACWALLGTVLRHYSHGAYEAPITSDGATLSVLAMAQIALLGAFALLDASRATFAQAGAAALTLWPAAVVLRLALRPLARREGPLEDVLVVGTGPVGQRLVRMLAAGNRRVVGTLAFRGEPADAGVLGPARDLKAVLKRTPVSEVYLAGEVVQHAEQMREAVKVCERLGVPFALPALAFTIQPGNQPGGDGFLHFGGARSRPHQIAMKRLFDLALASLGLLVLSPLMLAVALLVKLTSRGPVFFAQPRSGLHGKPFKMLKFRSMVVDAEARRAALEAQNEQSGPVFKMKHDPRVTAVGRFIRKYSIDELPQLFNVLMGDMSIVGPRPPLPTEVSRYDTWHLRRLSVRPGLTCVWQVSGRNQITFEQWMRMDLEYIDTWSLWRDLHLVLKTVPAVLRGRGAS